MQLPPLNLVRQRIAPLQEPDVAAAVHRELARLELAKRIRPGETVALTAGSRGIANIANILKETVRGLRSLGAQPFIVPAMGSHGGGTASGQTALIASYGITEEAVGAPIRASMDVVEIARHPANGPIFLDAYASRADHIGVIARVKPHTGFSGAIESGLVKMMMIGLGKHEGAKEYHRVLLRTAWEPFVRSVGQLLLETMPVQFGLAIIENELDQTALIEGVAPDQFLVREPALLDIARRMLPRLPVDEVDLLIIDEIGKDISGSGADTNVIGRKPTGDWNERDVRNAHPFVQRIYMRGLSPKTHGNATGIGLADFTKDSLIEEMDYEATVINCLTANHPAAAAIPVHYPTDKLVIEAALRTVGLEDPRQAKIAWISNSLEVRTLALSQPYDLTFADPPVDVLGPLSWPFDEKGNLANLKVATAEH